MGLQIRYNEAFDEEHYPIKDHHRKALEAIVEEIGIPETEQWWYFATIHGVIFKCDFSEEFLKNTAHLGRHQIGREEMQFFLDLPNFRYVEPGKTDFAIGLTHYEGEANNA